jgi:error-prone DNA polymerase
MKNLEGRLRAGMTSNGLDAATQETIIQNISSFALYGFPESHAASFALIAYASAYIKVKYLAAFTCAILNNQPMGFYSPAVLIEDARRHGLRVKPIDIQVSDWPCTVEHEDDQSLSLRLGLGYVRGLRGQCAEAIVRSRMFKRFESVDDLVLRVPQLNRKELALLANIGALNTLDGVEHRRDALWQVERAGKPEGPLLMQQSQWLREETSELPLAAMTLEERLVADYAVSSVTTGPHPMWFRRKELHRKGYLRAVDIESRPDGSWVKTAGLAFVKQRPGTASGVVFIGVADETGDFRIFVAPDFFEQNRRVIQQAKFIGVEGPIQKEGPIIHIMARSLYELSVENQAGPLKVTSHDFH